MATWLWALLSCTGADTGDSATLVTEPEPRWTQVDLSCLHTAHHWTAWATDLHGHAQLRLVPAADDGSEETHPLVVDDADPAGSWTLFVLDLVHAPDTTGAVPGRETPHDCRSEGREWTWAVDLLDGDQVIACTTGEVSDSAAVPQNVATCDVAK